jgi:antitoxin ParD1/3/4
LVGKPSPNFDSLRQKIYPALVHVSLTPELEKIVKKKVDSGLYDNASEVIREALRIALKVESENEWLKREAALGFAQLETGETVRVTTKKQFLSLARNGK